MLEVNMDAYAMLEVTKMSRPRTYAVNIFQTKRDRAVVSKRK